MLASTALPSALQTPYGELGELLDASAGQNLVALAAYGGRAVADPVYARDPADSLLVLKTLDFRVLDGLLAHGPRLGKRGLRAPLILTTEQIAHSADVFPLELLEISATGVLIRGVDPLGGTEFARRCLRLQCEREARSSLIHLQQGYLSAAGRAIDLAPSAHHAARRAVRLLRGLVRLHAAPPELHALNLVAQAARLANLQLPQLGAALGGADLPPPQFVALHDEFSALATYIDNLPETSPA